MNQEYHSFIAALEHSHPSACQDADDVAAEIKRRKAASFAAFMTYLDTHHPRTIQLHRNHRDHKRRLYHCKLLFRHWFAALGRQVQYRLGI